MEMKLIDRIKKLEVKFRTQQAHLPQLIHLVALNSDQPEKTDDEVRRITTAARNGCAVAMNWKRYSSSGRYRRRNSYIQAAESSALVFPNEDR
jgi:hypothetical protein